MISLENFREWLDATKIFLERHLPGLRLSVEGAYNVEWQRFEYEVVVYPPALHPKAIASYITLKQMQENPEAVLAYMKVAPHNILRAIKEAIEV